MSFRLQPLESNGGARNGGGFFSSLFGSRKNNGRKDVSPTNSVDSEIILDGKSGGGNRHYSNGTPRISDLEGNNSDSGLDQLGLPREPAAKPEKIVLQQNWLDDPRSASRQSSNPVVHHTKRVIRSFIRGIELVPLKNNFQPPRSPAVHKIRSISLTDTSAALLLPPKLEEFEFSKRDSLMPVRE